MIRKISPVLLLAALVAACASTPNLPPTMPDEVEVYDPELGQYPPDGYETIAPVSVQMPLSTPRADVVVALRTEAARLGAEAIVIQAFRSSSEGEIGTEAARQQRVIGEALAIYWPAQP